jgi:hypothetical protein
MILPSQPLAAAMTKRSTQGEANSRIIVWCGREDLNLFRTIFCRNGQFGQVQSASIQKRIGLSWLFLMQLADSVLLSYIVDF